MRKRELVALLCLSFLCLMIGVWLFLTKPWVCLQFVIAVFPDHTHYYGSSKGSQKSHETSMRLFNKTNADTPIEIRFNL